MEDTPLQTIHQNAPNMLCDPFDNLKGSTDNTSSDSCSDQDVPRARIKKRIKRFSDSDSDSGKEIASKIVPDVESEKPSKSSDSENDLEIFKSKPPKSRIQLNDASDSENGSENALKNEEQQLRMKNKRNKLKNKFKSLMSARGKEPSPSNIELELNKNDGSDSSQSDDEIGSIDKIKQKIKEKMSFKPSICDPDTSDEENTQERPVKQKERKIKLTSPKPQRMSAKQAMENMQKIKSESNRMLREKEVSLPYHRPKALSLKDIMNRRRPALTSDGKALPIKMNEQQLKQYAQMLEERQKEMMELCKSESDEEDDTDNVNDNNINKETISYNGQDKSEETASADKKCEELDINNKSDQIELTNDNNVDSDQIKEKENNISSKINTEIEMENQEGLENVSATKLADLSNKEQDSESSVQLVYNDSVNSEDGKSVLDGDVEANVNSENITVKTTENKNDLAIGKESETNDTLDKNETSNANPEDSQLISLHLDTEQSIAINTEELAKNTEEPNKSDQENDEAMDINEFSDDEINMGDIDSIIENAEIIRDIEDRNNSQILIRDKPLNTNPKLTGAPGMVIDLDDSEATPKKSGVELLKERFTYFSKLKTPDEIEREKEKKLKPGTQLKKLKQELEDKIAEQRSLEWAKRLEDEEQQQKELKMLRGEESDDEIEKLDKLEAQMEDEDNEAEKSESEPEEEPIENDIEIKDKVKPRNAMVDDEAEESDYDEQDLDENDDGKDGDDEENDGNNGDDEENDGNNGDDEQNDSDSDESDSSESEDEQQSVTHKKGRILKAFEDSDDEDASEPVDSEIVAMVDTKIDSVQSQMASQDVEIQLAQRHKSGSDDLFSQETITEVKDKPIDSSENNENFTQTFSILESSKQIEEDLNCSDKIIVTDTQSLESTIENEICPMTDSQKDLPMPSQLPAFVSQSQTIGEDVLALCTGQFYNNEFISQVDDAPLEDSLENEISQEKDITPTNDMKDQDLDTISDGIEIKEPTSTNIVNQNLNTKDDFIELNVNKERKIIDDNLKSILDELDDPEFENPKPNLFFTGGNTKEQNDKVGQDNLGKKKFIIDSDDDANENGSENKKKKKLKKKKAEKRALQISDDEEESEQEEVEYESDIEEEIPDRLVEYDSEENEIEIKPQNSRKKRKTTEFFENEAELTSEDEWVGSGDEDEAGLDRMEREEGDDDTFHQGQLQRELGQIHMRDVLDQDKREVRIIQELLFEDGDLGAGGRQRKFKWKNIDGEEELGTIPEFGDTQEEEFESEEQWRKQRHEREVFLREMRSKEDPEESLNVSVNRTAIIKANLTSKTMSSLLLEVNNTDEKTEVNEKKTAKDIPSPKKPFILMQQNYQGSMLSRGRGALARLAALATPLAADDDAKVGTLGPSSRRNFVFTAITPDEEPKVTKRKAPCNPGTPNLVKKMRIEEKNTQKNSLLDHF